MQGSSPRRGRPRSAPASAFLPTCRADLEARGWDRLDVLIVSGDAYVDHPAFGPVIIARALEAEGYRVGIVAQPSWSTIEDLARMGTPRLFVGVSAGNLDSMLNKLTAQKKTRSQEQYSPGGRLELRPNRATIVYSNLCRQAFPGVPIVLGGIEASLRRIAHYDYWSDQVRRSILLDAKADLLVFGMGETAVVEIARRLSAGGGVASLCGIRGTARVLSREERSSWQETAESTERTDGPVVLPSYESVASDPVAFATMTRLVYLESNPHNARPLMQPHGSQAVWLEPPSLPLDPEGLERLYRLPFQRAEHPSYAEPVPALRSVRHSVAVTRGCFGGCAFCAITCHEGRIVQSRPKEGVLREVRALCKAPGFPGVITDVGGPTANMYGMSCGNERAARMCRRTSCVHPAPCRYLRTDHGEYIRLLRAVRTVPGVKHAFVASGVRHDLALRSPAFIRELAEHHTGGQLSIAPEHVNPEVLALMRKPPASLWEQFEEAFLRASSLAGKRQFVVPYFIVGHPGSTLRDTIELALWLKRRSLRPRQIQEFIPTPMTLATAMYHTGLDPMTMKPVVVVRDLREKRMMKALLLYWDAEQWPLAREALVRAGRTDLIGRGPGSLVPSRDGQGRSALPGASRAPGSRQGARRRDSQHGD